ncbi:hypothetical protein MBLNU459_g0487t1 [Dothideomycetes sp. NU459]
MLSSRDVMSISFLAPQASNHASGTRFPQSKAMRDEFAFTQGRSQLEAVAYGVNVRASMSFSQHEPACPPREAAGDTVSSRRSSQQSQGSPEGGRETRTAYSEHMQFFIMYSRVALEHDWRRIEDDFEKIFGQRRAKDGLTAVYYRIRKNWGMKQVLQNAPERHHEDMNKVHERSKHYSNDFLRQIGYLD